MTHMATTPKLRIRNVLVQPVQLAWVCPAVQGPSPAPSCESRTVPRRQVVRCRARSAILMSQMCDGREQGEYRIAFRLASPARVSNLGVGSSNQHLGGRVVDSDSSPVFSGDHQHRLSLDGSARCGCYLWGYGWVNWGSAGRSIWASTDSGC